MPWLTHLHIVRYYQAWIETEVPDVRKGGPHGGQGGGTRAATRPGKVLSSDWKSSEPAAADLGRGRLQQNMSGHAKEFLYIQMEHCNGKTLREAIDEEGWLAEGSQIWRIFRQILDAIDYIHVTKKSIHRDLKPGNIFLLVPKNKDAKDAKGEVTVKIGDFGLSTTLGERRESIGDLASPTSGKSKQDRAGDETEQPRAGKNMSTGVGTQFYVAPEVRCKPRLGSTRPYDQRADLFSLGVIFFEMWHGPCETRHERNMLLSALEFEPESEVQAASRSQKKMPSEKAQARQRQYPVGFGEKIAAKDPDKDHVAKVTTIINSLLSADPTLRFEAAEMLYGDLLPVHAVDQRERQRLLDALEHNPRGAENDHIIKWLFGHNRRRREKSQKEVTYFQRYLQEPPPQEAPSNFIGLALAKSAAVQHLLAHFRRHGCAVVDVPLMHPFVEQEDQHQGTHHEEQHPHLLVDSANTLLALRTGLTSPFARTASHGWTQAASRARGAEAPAGSGFRIASFGVVQDLPIFRRCHVGTVYSQPIPEAPGPAHLEYGHPTELSSAIFDFLWLGSSSSEGSASASQRSTGSRMPGAQELDSELLAFALESEMLLACMGLLAGLPLPSGARPELRITNTLLLPTLLRATGLLRSLGDSQALSVSLELGAHARSFAAQAFRGQKANLEGLRKAVHETLRQRGHGTRSCSPVAPRGPSSRSCSPIAPLESVVAGSTQRARMRAASPVVGPETDATDVARKLAEAHRASSTSESLRILQDLLAGTPASDDKTKADALLRDLQELAGIVEGTVSDLHCEATSARGGDCSQQADMPGGWPGPAIPAFTVLVDPLLEADRSLYDGLAFAVVVSAPGFGGPTHDLLRGGRYDRLIEHFTRLHMARGGARVAPGAAATPADTYGAALAAGMPAGTHSAVPAGVCGISAELAVDKIALYMLKAEDSAMERESRASRAGRRAQAPRRGELSAADAGENAQAHLTGSVQPLSSGGWPQVVICHLPSDRYCSNYDDPDDQSLAREAVKLAGGLRRLGVRCETRLAQESSWEQLLRRCRGLPGCQFLVVLKRQHDDFVQYAVKQIASDAAGRSDGRGRARKDKRGADEVYTSLADICKHFAGLKANSKRLQPNSQCVPSPLLLPKDIG